MTRWINVYGALIDADAVTSIERNHASGYLFDRVRLGTAGCCTEVHLPPAFIDEQTRQDLGPPPKIEYAVPPRYPKRRPRRTYKERIAQYRVDLDAGRSAEADTTHARALWEARREQAEAKVRDRQFAELVARISPGAATLITEGDKS